MDLASRLQQLEDIVRDAKSMPLSASALVNREELLGLIGEMKESLPEEIKQARWVVKDREDLLAKARRDAERIVDEARDEQLRMAKREAIVQRAEEEAERIRREADEEARRMRLESEDYIDARLAQFEHALVRVGDDLMGTNEQLSRTLEQIAAGREKLRAAAPAVNPEIGPEVAFPDEDELPQDGGS